MKKQYLFGFVVAILALALAFTGCNSGDGGDDNKVPYDPLVILGKSGDKVIKTTFTTQRTTTKAALTPTTLVNGDSYEIVYDGNSASKGQIEVGSGTSSYKDIKFKPESNGIQFAAILVTSGSNGGSLAFPDGITKSTGDKITGYINDNATNPKFANPADDDLKQDGASLKVKVDPNAGGALSYSWYSADANVYTGALISAATADTYALPTNSTATKYYYVYITNTSGGFLRSKILEVKGSGGNNAGGDITNYFSAGDEFVEKTTNDADGTTLIKIKKPVNLTDNIQIPVKTTLQITGEGTLTIPVGKTITVKGNLVVESTLIVNGEVIVESEGIFEVKAGTGASRAIAATSDDSKLGGSGKITVRKGGKMQIPKLDNDTQTFKDVTDAIVVEAGGDLYTMESPWIGTDKSKDKDNKEAGADFVVTEGYITLKLIFSDDKLTPYIFLYGKAMVLGQLTGSGTNATRGTVKIQSVFTVNPDTILTIGNDTEASILDADGGMIFNNGTITVKANSKITARESSAIIGPVTGTDGKPITFDKKSGDTTGKWENPPPAKT